VLLILLVRRIFFATPPYDKTRPWAAYALAAILGPLGALFAVASLTSSTDRGSLLLYAIVFLGATVPLVRLGRRRRQEIRSTPRARLAPEIPKGFAAFDPTGGVPLVDRSTEAGQWRIEDLFPPLPPDRS
jgi:hypothetical protein